MNKFIGLWFLFIAGISPYTYSQETAQTFFNFGTFEDQIRASYTNTQNTFINQNGRVYAEIGSDMFLLSNWLVTLSNRDGENPLDRKDSYPRKINSEEQGTVLGIRVKYPDWPFPGEAFVRPTFPILPFKFDGSYANVNNGVVTNVGILKSFSQWVNGRGFAHNLFVRVLNGDNSLQEIPLGSMRFFGWRRLEYLNPLFPDRPEELILPVRPIYPHTLPLLRFDSFVIRRPGNEIGGDFVTYLGSSEISYSPYYLENNLDINDEEEWGIQRKKQEDAARVGNIALYDKIVQYEYARKRWEYAQTGARGTQNNPQDNNPQDNNQ